MPFFPPLNHVFPPERHPSSLKVLPPTSSTAPVLRSIPPRPNPLMRSPHPHHTRGLLFFSLPCPAVKHSHQVHNDAKSALLSQLSLPITSTHAKEPAPQRLITCSEPCIKGPRRLAPVSIVPDQTTHIPIPKAGRQLHRHVCRRPRTPVQDQTS
jgi:hypothetical protein